MERAIRRRGLDAAGEVCRNVDLIDHRSLRDRPLPENVRVAAERRLVSCLAEARRRRDDPLVIASVELARISGGEPVAPIAARPERSDRYFSSLINGMLAENSCAAAFGAFVATAGAGALNGSQTLGAFALGCEVQSKFARALRAEEQRGWDVAGIAGVLSSAMTAALLLDATADETARAIGIASSMTLGQRDATGTMSEALTRGKAASNGVLAALFAKRGLSGPQLDTPRGYGALFHVASGAEILAELVEWRDIVAASAALEDAGGIPSPLLHAVRDLAGAQDARALLGALAA